MLVGIYPQFASAGVVPVMTFEKILHLYKYLFTIQMACRGVAEGESRVS